MQNCRYLSSTHDCFHVLENGYIYFTGKSPQEGQLKEGVAGCEHMRCILLYLSYLLLFAEEEDTRPLSVMQCCIVKYK